MILGESGAVLTKACLQLETRLIFNTTGSRIGVQNAKDVDEAVGELFDALEKVLRDGISQS